MNIELEVVNFESEGIATESATEIIVVSGEGVAPDKPRPQ